MTIIEGQLVVGLTKEQQNDKVLPESGSLVVYEFDGASLSQ